MTKSFELYITGADIMASDLKRMARLDDVKNYVEYHGSQVQQTAVRIAPYDTGHLSRSIELYFTDGGFTARIYPTAMYAYYVEYGTRKMSAQPYVGPAFARQENLFYQDMTRFLR